MIYVIRTMLVMIMMKINGWERHVNRWKYPVDKRGRDGNGMGKNASGGYDRGGKADGEVKVGGGWWGRRR